MGWPIAELPIINSAIVGRQKVQEPLVIRLRNSEELEERPVVAARRLQASAQEFAQVVTGNVAIEEMRIDIVPERIAARDNRLIQVVCKLPPAFVGRRK